MSGSKYSTPNENGAEYSTVCLPAFYLNLSIEMMSKRHIRSVVDAEISGGLF